MSRTDCCFKKCLTHAKATHVSWQIYKISGLCGKEQPHEALQTGGQRFRRPNRWFVKRLGEAEENIFVCAGTLRCSVMERKWQKISQNTHLVGLFVNAVREMSVPVTTFVLTKH